MFGFHAVLELLQGVSGELLEFATDLILDLFVGGGDLLLCVELVDRGLGVALLHGVVVGRRDW